MVPKIRVRLQHGAKAIEQDVTKKQFTHQTLCALADTLCGANGACRHFAYIDEAREVVVIAGQVDIPEAWRVAVGLGGALVIYLLLAHQRGTSPLPLRQSYSASSTPAPKTPPNTHQSRANIIRIDSRLSHSLPCLKTSSNESLQSISSKNSEQENNIFVTNSINSNTNTNTSNKNESLRWKDYVLSSGNGYRLILQTRLTEENAPYIGVAISMCKGLRDEVGLTDLQHVLVVDAMASALANLGKSLRPVTPTKDTHPTSTPVSAGEQNQTPLAHPPHQRHRHPPSEIIRKHPSSTSSSTSLTNSMFSSDEKEYSLQEKLGYSSDGSTYLGNESTCEYEREYESRKECVSVNGKGFRSEGAQLSSDFVFPSCLDESSIVQAGNSKECWPADPLPQPSGETESDVV